jgi:hypothetical protein
VRSGKRFIVVFAIGLITSLCWAAESRQVIIDIPTFDNAEPQNYYLDLLRLVLEESKAPDEEIVFRYARWPYSQARWVYLLQHDTGNLVIWTMTSKHRESLLLPVRIPLFRGLFGKRVFIIRKQDQEHFDKLHTLEDLSQLVAGQGMHWPDVDVLQANNLRVTTANRSDSLIKMLKAERFDYYPRAVTEAWHELSNLDDDELMVERGLMLEYPTAVYYFVSPKNTALAERIESGLVSLIKDGRFDTFFNEHPRVKQGLAELNAGPRRLIQLENPGLPDIWPPPGARYWLEKEEPVEARTDSASASR